MKPRYGAPPPLPCVTAAACRELCHSLDSVLTNSELLREIAAELNRRIESTTYSEATVALVLYELRSRAAARRGPQ